MNTQSYALISLFAALAIVLNVIRIPVVYWPNMFYTFCDIPVLVAFLIYGFKIGFLVEVIHILGQEIFFPAGPAGIVFYPMGFFTHLFMFSGIYLASKFISRKAASKMSLSEKKRTIYFTGFATAFRGGFMPIIDFAVLYNILLPLVLGITIPETYIVALVPSFIIYNITSTLYAVPISYFIVRKTSKYLGMKAKFLIQS
jgi:riboflavin transporter FmnP